MIFKKFLPPGYSQSHLQSFAKKSFVVANLNFFVEWKNAFFTETVCDRVISMKFFIPRLPSELCGTFTKKLFSCHFGCHLEFLREMQKHLHLRNGMRLSNFDEIFNHRI